jgi:hypothetical protein
VAEDLEVYQDLGIRLPPNFPTAQRSCALMTLFRSDGPSAKSYHRFSSVEVPLHLALAFESIAKPWPDAGVLGDTIDIREMNFLCTIDLTVGPPVSLLEYQPSTITDGDDQCEAYGPIVVQDRCPE